MSATESPSRRYASLGMRRIWIGTLLILGIQISFDFTRTIQSLGDYDDPTPVFTGWAVLVVANLAVILVTRTLGEHLPGCCSGCSSSHSAWPWPSTSSAPGDRSRRRSGSPSAYRRASPSSSRRSRALRSRCSPPPECSRRPAGLAMMFNNQMLPDTASDAAFTLCQMFLPVAVATTIVGAFRSLVRREDRGDALPVGDLGAAPHGRDRGVRAARPARPRRGGPARRRRRGPDGAAADRRDRAPGRHARDRAAPPPAGEPQQDLARARDRGVRPARRGTSRSRTSTPRPDCSARASALRCSRRSGSSTTSAASRRGPGGRRSTSPSRRRFPRPNRRPSTRSRS